jgi:competence protein ComEA
MIKSLAVKSGMLVTTVLLVLWMGWPAPLDPTMLAGVQTGEGEREETALQREEPHTAPQATVATTSSIPTGARSQGKQGKLDLNRATAEELQHLPGIGPVLAQRVIEQRTTHGAFHTVDGLRNVKGIGKKRMDQLRPLIMVDQVTKVETKQDARLKAKTL